jgi:hypothetical protein
MARRFLKDAWIKAALLRCYLLVDEDGTIRRANKADPVTGRVDFSKGYSVVAVQTHKPTGRVYFNMTFVGFTKSVLVNRVVAWAFHPNPDNLPQVNHIDGVKAHNGKDNLEWSSGSDNEKHAHRTGLKSGRGSANSNAKLAVGDVLAIRASVDPVKDLMARYDVSRSTIVNIRNGKTWSHV